MDDEPKRKALDVVAGLIGEFLREMAVLIVVFAPLDAFTRASGLTVSMVYTTIAIVAVLLGLGILLEVKRS